MSIEYISLRHREAQIDKRRAKKALLHVNCASSRGNRNQVHREATIPPCHCFLPIFAVHLGDNPLAREQRKIPMLARNAIQNRGKVLDAGKVEIDSRTMMYRLMKAKRTENRFTS